MDKEQCHREVQAETEVGHTVIRPLVALSLVLFFLLAVVGPFLWDSVHHATENSTFHPVDEAFRLLPRSATITQTLRNEGLLRGAAELNSRTLQRMESFETRLQSTSPLRTRLVTPLNHFFSGMLGANNADVYPGRAGWLFYGPAVRHVTGPSFLQRLEGGAASREVDPVAAIRVFQAQLEERGIALVLLPVPGKVSIYPEGLTGAFDGQVAVQNVAYEDFLRRLQEGGVLVFDVTAMFMEGKGEETLYLREDSHWTPLGMARCAKALAAFIEEHVLLPAEGKRSYRNGEGEIHCYRGDLATMLYPEAQTNDGTQECVEIRPVLEPDGEPWTPEKENTVLLLGDSFTNIYSKADLGWGTDAGLTEQLSFYLQRPVDRISQNNNGAFATRQALSEALARGTDRLSHTRVVVYEFAARELSWGDWKTALPLEGGAPPKRVIQTSTSVTGQILERSLPPAPGSVPYKDCIVSLLLEPADDPSRQLLVHAWGMRDNQWTEVTGWHVGDKVNLELENWSLVAPVLESINRVPLEDESLGAARWWLKLEPAKEVASAQIPLEVSTPASTQKGGGLVELVQQLEITKQAVLRGKDRWLFLTSELRSLSVGPFWGDAAPQVSRARNKQYADPLPAMLDFHRQLKDRGIELILMPVPPKAGIYTDEIEGDKLRSDLRVAMEPTSPLNTFLDQIKAAGITIIDLQAAFDRERGAEDEPFYCRTDSHWSPRGCAVAAALVADKIHGKSWYEKVSKTVYTVKRTALTFRGDLAVLAGGDVSDEEVLLQQVGLMEDGAFTPLSPLRQSPVLLIGDSHNLVFHAGGDMHAIGGGLPDLLAQSLGFPVDLVAVRGSGATAPRSTLARRRDNLAGKKVVVWCFAAREFTESTTGWRVIPVIREP